MYRLLIAALLVTAKDWKQPSTSNRGWRRSCYGPSVGFQEGERKRGGSAALVQGEEEGTDVYTKPPFL